MLAEAGFEDVECFADRTGYAGPAGDRRLILRAR
jgi:hypothetical protein